MLSYGSIVCGVVVVVHFAPKVNRYAEVCVSKAHCVK